MIWEFLRNGIHQVRLSDSLLLQLTDWGNGKWRSQILTDVYRISVAESWNQDGGTEDEERLRAKQWALAEILRWANVLV